jgi:MFS transporter, FSR family, fosmidomycin resistance protein
VRTVRIGLVLCVPGIAGLLLAPNLPTALAATALAGLGVFIPFSVDVTLGQEYLPHRVGTASGITLGLSVSIGGVATPALGLLADAHGLAAVFLVLAALPVLGLAACVALPEPRKESHDDRVHVSR